jgi:hypothetical protein
MTGVGLLVGPSINGEPLGTGDVGQRRDGRQYGVQRVLFLYPPVRTEEASQPPALFPFLESQTCGSLSFLRSNNHTHRTQTLSFHPSPFELLKGLFLPGKSPVFDVNNTYNTVDSL